MIFRNDRVTGKTFRVLLLVFICYLTQSICYEHIFLFSEDSIVSWCDENRKRRILKGARIVSIIFINYYIPAGNKLLSLVKQRQII